MLAMDIQVLGIIITESLGLIFFLLALTFLQMSRRIGGKREALEDSQKNTVSGKIEENCFSFRWAMERSMKSRKVFGANPILIAIPFVLALGTGFILLTLFQSIGYVMLLSFVGMTIFLDSEAFEAFGYGKAIIKASLTQLNNEDQSYMKIAKEALELATARFFMVGIILAVIGPFIQKLFDGLIYAIAMYSIVLFSTTETAYAISPVLACFIAMVLPGILLYLPELVGRTLFHKMKELGLIRKMLRHGAPAEEEQLPYTPMYASDNVIAVNSHGNVTPGRIIINSHNTITILDKRALEKENPEEA